MAQHPPDTHSTLRSCDANRRHRAQDVHPGHRHGQSGDRGKARAGLHRVCLRLLRVRHTTRWTGYAIMGSRLGFRIRRAIGSVTSPDHRTRQQEHDGSLRKRPRRNTRGEVEAGSHAECLAERVHREPAEIPGDKQNDARRLRPARLDRVSPGKPRRPLNRVQPQSLPGSGIRTRQHGIRTSSESFQSWI